MVNHGVCGTAHLALWISFECTFTSKWETLPWSKTMLRNPPIKMFVCNCCILQKFTLDHECFSRYTGLVLFRVRDKCYGKSIMCRRLSDSGEKQLNTGRAAPIVNEATSVCGPRDDRFIRKCQWRRGCMWKTIKWPTVYEVEDSREWKDKGKRQMIR